MGILALLKGAGSCRSAATKEPAVSAPKWLKKFFKKNGKLYFYNTTQMKLLSTFATIIAYARPIHIYAHSHSQKDKRY